MTKKRGAKSRKNSVNDKKISEKIKGKFDKGKEKVKKTRLGLWVYNLKHEHKILFLVIIVLLILFFIIFGARMYLFFNFILGNDTIVKLTVNQQDFFMQNSEKGVAEFSIYVSTNVFCEAQCDYTFEDLSSGYILDKQNFSATLANPNKLDYSIVAPERGEGQKLYHFEVSCYSKRTTLCKTDEEPRRRSLLVALNYELSEAQKEFREKSSDSLKDLILETDELTRISLENEKMYEMLSDIIQVERMPKNNLSMIEEELDIKLEEWKGYEYEIILEDNLVDDLNHTRKILVNYNNNLTSNFIEYNQFVFNLNEIRKDVVDLTKVENISYEDYQRISSIVLDFNDMVRKTNEPFDLNLANNSLLSLKSNIQATTIDLKHNFNHSYFYPEIEVPMLSNIEKPFYSNYSSGRIIQSEEPMCCYKGDCQICCANDCQSDESKYPIILVHGHSFNNAVSAESSLGDLDSIRLALAKDGVIDGGYIVLRQFNQTGTFARTNRRIVFATSYYFDIFQNKEEFTILPTKGDSLDTYAIRLNDIVENVKRMTQRDKVVIVAHSMGGLVSRRYIQIFGDSSVDNLIMIGTPNHGVDGYILSGCSLLGAQNHCIAMDKDSLFLNKLNYGKRPETNVSVIVGLGCPMNGEDGDGIVKNSSAYLPWAKNYYVSGNCSGVDFFHVSMLNTQKYPETYKIIKKEIGLE